MLCYLPSKSIREWLQHDIEVWDDGSRQRLWPVVKAWNGPIAAGNATVRKHPLFSFLSSMLILNISFLSPASISVCQLQYVCIPLATRWGSQLPRWDMGHPSLLLLRWRQHGLLWQQRPRRLLKPSAFASSMCTQLSRTSWVPVLDVGQGLPHGALLPQAFERQCVSRINQLCLRL